MAKIPSKGKGKPAATSKKPSKNALKPKVGKQSNTPTLKAAMAKLAGGVGNPNG